MGGPKGARPAGRPAATTIDKILEQAWIELEGLAHDRLLRGLSIDNLAKGLHCSSGAVRFQIVRHTEGTEAADLQPKQRLIWLLVNHITESAFVARTGVQNGADGSAVRHGTRAHLEKLLADAQDGNGVWPGAIRSAARRVFEAALHQQAAAMRVRMLLWSLHHDDLIATALRRRFEGELVAYAGLYEEILAAFDRELVEGVSIVDLLDELAALQDGYVLRAEVDVGHTRWAHRFADSVVRVLTQVTVERARTEMPLTVREASDSYPEGLKARSGSA